VNLPRFRTTSAHDQACQVLRAIQATSWRTYQICQTAKCLHGPDNTTFYFSNNSSNHNRKYSLQCLRNILVYSRIKWKGKWRRALNICFSEVPQVHLDIDVTHFGPNTFEFSWFHLLPFDNASTRVQLLHKLRSSRIPRRTMKGCYISGPRRL
jgi:hypothetical protein